MVIGCFPDLCVADVGRSVSDYRQLFGLDVRVDHGWYAELGHAGTTLIAFVEAGHETVPPAAHHTPSGVLVTIEVRDAEMLHGRAIDAGWPIVVGLVTELGQRHFMIADPDGIIVDVIERVPLTALDHRRLVQLRRDRRLIE